MILTSEAYTDYPIIPKEVLEETKRQAGPDVFEKILTDDALYSQGAAALEQQDSEQPEEATPPEPTPTEEPTKELAPEQPAPEAPATENPFQSLGMPDEIYQQLLEEGKIKDGKLHGKYGPEDPEGFWNYYINESKLRGKLAQEVGDRRQEVKTKEQELENTRKEFKKVQEVASQLEEKLHEIELRAKNSFNEESLVFGQDINGLSDEQLEIVKAQATTKAKEVLANKFARRGERFPESEDDWDRLKSDHPDLFAAADSALDKQYADRARWALETIQMAKDYEDVRTRAYNDSAYKFIDFLQKNGVEADDDTPEIKKAVVGAVSAIEKEIKNARLQNRLPDSRFVQMHPTTGYAIPSVDGIKRYIAEENPDLYKQFLTNSFVATNPSPEPETTSPATTVTQEEAVQDIAKALEAYSSYLSKFDLELAEDDPFMAEAMEFIVARQDDPMYWENGHPREDMFIRYLSNEKPSVLVDRLKEKQTAELSAAAKTLEEKATQALMERFQKATESDSLLGSDTRGNTKTGATGPALPEPETFNDSFKMQSLAKQMFPEMTPADAINKLYDVFEPQIMAISNPEIRKQYGY